jgi:glutathione synthase/RimK-type ligase-like ATP-grasp enzyme
LETILILGKETDEHVLHVNSTLISSGFDTLILDTSEYPSKFGISWDPQCADGEISVSGRVIKFSDIKSVYWRMINQIQVNQKMDQAQLSMVTVDSNSMLRTLLEDVRPRWVNSWNAYQFHEVKPLQLSLAAKLGANIPKSIIGNSPKPVVEFLNKVENAIFKPVHGGAHTVRITKEMLVTGMTAAALEVAPITIQEFIEGTNVRTYVIGNSVYSAEFFSEHTDYRDDQDIMPISCDTPNEIADLAKNITKAFGMLWTAIDWRKTEEGKYYFLEANPSPMFINFEKITGMPITSKLVKLLTHF